MNIKDNYEERVIKLWEKYSDLDVLNETGCEYRKSPLLPAEIEDDSVLFIGINPAFKKGDIIPEDKRKIDFYPQNHKDEVPDLAYFRKFHDIANYCNVSWTHIDMLFVRETNQKIMDKLSYSKKGVDFITEQINIVFEIIDKAKPKLIVVSNAFASELFGKKKTKHQSFDKIWKGYSLNFPEDFNKDFGTYTIPIGGKDTPIIFSGMLSGQRALDIGSLERLKWQIKMILSK